MIKSLKKYAIAAALLVSLTPCVCAQRTADSDEQGTAVTRRRPGNERRGSREQQPGAPVVTDRMQNFYETDRDASLSDADRQWMRVIYRQIDLDSASNAALYYPEETIDGQENLFRIIMRLLANNQVAAYEYLDGREVFTDQYKIKVRDLLDRFHILYKDAKGSTERNPRFVIEESDVPSNEVLSYYIIERWEFDTRYNRLRPRVEAICPVLHRAGDFGGEAVKYPMFWIKFSDIRPWLAQQSIFIDDDNNLPSCSYDDFFNLTMYKGDIYKTRNLRNKSMMQLYPDPDDRRRAQDSIQARLDKWEDKLWVPSREEVIAAREAREAAERGDTATVTASDKSVDKAVRSTKRSTKRSSKKIKEPKQTKSNAASSAVRSVRKRRR